MPRKGRPCPLCGGDMLPGTTDYCEDRRTGVIVIRNVPAIICDQCGYDAVSSAVAQEIEELVATRPVPTRTIDVPVYELINGRYEAPVTDDVVNKQRKVV